MGDRPFEFDEIGYWSEVKLEIIRKYAHAYSTIMAKKPVIKRHIYVDGFAGAGQHISKMTGDFVPGSPLNALHLVPPFSEIHLIDLHGGKASELRRLTATDPRVTVYEGNCNKVLLERVFPRCRYADHHRALCLLDPYSLNVNWEVLEAAGKMKSVEVFYNFMVMDANMNVFRRNRSSVSAVQAKRMDAVWPGWRSAAYQTKRGLFGDMEEKSTNEEVAQAFREQLKSVAGFEYVPDPMPMRNSKGAVVYYLFFASPNRLGGKIVKNIFDRYRQQGI